MSPILRAIQSWWLIALLSAGCTSYQKTSLAEIQSHPDKLVDKDVRVHYDAADSVTVTRRSSRDRFGTEKQFTPDSVVAMRVTSVRYPVIAGQTVREAKIFGSANPIVPLRLNVEDSRKVEVRGFSVKKMLLGVCAAGLLFAAVYGATSSIDIGPLFSGSMVMPLVPNPPPPTEPRKPGGRGKP